MAINWSTQVYAPQYDMYARPVTFNPVKSQPNAPAYSGRGIYNTVSIDVAGEDNTIISDARTILDILESEFPVQPKQGDRVTIPANNGMVDLGEFEITDTNTNGGGETTLFLRKWMTATYP